MPDQYKFLRIDNFTGGLNLKNDDSVTNGGIAPSQCLKAMNCDFRDHVSVHTRDSYKKKFLSQYDNRIVGIYPYYKNTEQHLMLKTWDGYNYNLYDNVKSVYTNATGKHFFYPAVYDNILYHCDGANENKKYDGATVSKLGITAPDTAATLAEGAAGNLTGTYYFYYSYYNSNTGHESALSPVGEITVASKKVIVTPVLPNDPQITHIRIYRSGGDAGYTNSAGTYTKHRVYDADTASDDVISNGEMIITDVSLDTELITNGGFDTDTWWSKTGGVQITGGVATLTDMPVTTIGRLFRSGLLTVDTGYHLTFKITEVGTREGYTGVKIGTCGPAGDDRFTDYWLREVGSYSYNFVATYTGFFFNLLTNKYFGTSYTISIDDVSLKATTLNYTDNVADTDLITTVEDCDTNLVLASVNIFTVHHHELFGGNSDDYPGYIYDSRFYKPEAFPATAFTQIGHASDPIMAMMPFDIDLVVYTRYKMFRYRYIGASESDIILEELTNIGCAAGRTLAEGTLENGLPFHIFLGQSTRGRGIYMFDGQSCTCISTVVEPLFSGEREDVTSMNWNAVENCCAAIADNKYYLAYPEGASKWSDKVLIADFETTPPTFIRADFAASALCYDVYAGVLYMGNVEKYLYEFTGSHNLSEQVEIDFQTPYVGDRTKFHQLKSLIFFANTRDTTMTVNVWVDRKIEYTTTCSSTYMKRIEIDCPPACKGRLFSIEFVCASYRRIKLTPPLLFKVVEFKDR